ncbi:MAG: hypothetical protein FWG98_13540 [Candidatus Cloacimonetes bacterium]|nr:hypothetical protein [Candidatus Cloacimonadota bacterium]
MKYMTFNRSCSYTGLANMLEQFGINITDREIIIQAAIPYCFYYDGEEYFAGSMLQSKYWFDLFLKPKGFEIEEYRFSKLELIGFLEPNVNVMMGIKTIHRTESKHAVIYKGFEQGKYKFLNMRHETEQVPDFDALTQQELMEACHDETFCSIIVPADDKVSIDMSLASQSYKNYEIYYNEMKVFLSKTPTFNDLSSMKHRLFTPLMLDILSMLQIADETEIYDVLYALRVDYMDMLKKENTDGLTKFRDSILECMSKIGDFILERNHYK